MPLSPWSHDVLARLEKVILPDYIPTCRWFGGKGRAVRDFRVVQAVPIGTLPAARLLVIEITFADGATESYSLPLCFVDAATEEALEADRAQAVLARGKNGHWLCDAIHLAKVRSEILRLIARRESGNGPVRLDGSSRDDLEEALLERALEDSRVTGADQSNTSVIYAGRWFLKLFRKFESGPNPDVDLTRFLSETGGFANVPRYLGTLQFTEPAGASVLALLTDFTPNQGDGWTFTLGAVARFFDSVPAPRAAPRTLEEMIGGEYLDRARQLGRRTAEMHLALASGEDRPEFAPEPFTMPDQRALYAAMSASSARVLEQLRLQAPHLPESIRPAAAGITRGQNRIDERFALLLSHPIHAAKIRVHGDYHLGQVLNTGTDFVILDFEGEPRRPLRERLLKRSPLVDVAGMLRSFDYAGAAGLQVRDAAEAEELRPWARAWVDAVSEQFLETYLQLTAGAPFLPPESSDVALLLEVFILDKAIYEIGYELSYRPGFLPIPLGAVSRLLAGKSEAPRG